MEHINPYCGLYLDTDLDRDVVLGRIRDLTDGSLRLRTISSRVMDIDVSYNDTFDVSRRDNPSDGFLYFRYRADVQPVKGSDLTAYIQTLGDLIRNLRQGGLQVEAACDFEDLLRK